MPIVKIMPSKSSVRHIEAYIKNPDKTNPDLYFSNLCDRENVSESFKQWERYFSGKQKQRSYYHFIISFNPKDDLTPMKCKELVEEICSKSNLAGYPMFGTIHTDREHLHGHLIVSNTSVLGKSYQSTRKSTQEIKAVANEICVREGLVHSVIDPERKAKDRLSMAEAQMILKRKVMPWKELLRHQISEAIEATSAPEEFQAYMKKRFGVEVSQNKKGEWRFLSQDMKKPCPERRLGEDYTRVSIVQKLEMKAKHKSRGCAR